MKTLFWTSTQLLACKSVLALPSLSTSDEYLENVWKACWSHGLSLIGRPLLKPKCGQKACSVLLHLLLTSHLNTLGQKQLEGSEFIFLVFFFQPWITFRIVAMNQAIFLWLIRPIQIGESVYDDGDLMIADISVSVLTKVCHCQRQLY